MQRNLEPDCPDCGQGYYECNCGPMPLNAGPVDLTREATDPFGY